jgi:hypothetical protein
MGNEGCPLVGRGHFQPVIYRLAQSSIEQPFNADVIGFFKHNLKCMSGKAQGLHLYYHKKSRLFRAGSY